MKAKKHNKGLSDAQLIEKYEKGRISLKPVERMLKEAPTRSDRPERRKKKE